MDTMSAYLNAQAASRRGDRTRVFDWTTAAKLIKDRHAEYVAAGLEGEWEHTGGVIYLAGGIPDEDQRTTYLASVWATPQIDLDGEFIDCWVYQDESPGWGSGTFWPQEALDILLG